MTFRGYSPMSLRDVAMLGGLTRTEVPGREFASKYPEEQNRFINGVVESVTNRTASPQYNKIPGVGMPGSVESIGNAPSQFSAVNGPKGRPMMAGVANTASSSTQRQVNSHLFNLAAGAQQDFPGSVNYMNPFASSPQNMAAWGNDLVNTGTPVGFEKTMHVYGVDKYHQPAYGTPVFSKPDMESLAMSAQGIGDGMQGPIAADSIDRALGYGDQAHKQSMGKLMSDFSKTPYGGWMNNLSGQDPNALPSMPGAPPASSFDALNPAPELGAITSQPLGPVTLADHIAQAMPARPNSATPASGYASAARPFSGTPASAYPSAQRPFSADPASAFASAQRPVSYSPLNRAPIDQVSTQPLSAPFAPPQRPVSYSPLNAAPASPVNVSSLAPVAPQRPVNLSPGRAFPAAPVNPGLPGLSPQQMATGTYQSNFGLPGLANALPGEMNLPTASSALTAAMNNPAAPQPSMPARPFSPTPALAPRPQPVMPSVAAPEAQSLPTMPPGMPGATASPAPASIGVPSITPNTPTIGNMPQAETSDPQTTATHQPSFASRAMHAVGAVGRTLGNSVRGASLGATLGGPGGALVGGAVPLANGIMGAFGTNMNSLFNGPVAHPGSSPATQNDVVANAAPSVLSQVNRLDLGPAPQGYHYGYSPFGQGIAAVSNSAPENSQIAGTGPGLLGAFGFGTSKDGYNNGPTQTSTPSQSGSKDGGKNGKNGNKTDNSGKRQDGDSR